ncbi:hypothetical protein [Desulfovibrio sp. TomC]|uniref:hypothetical protein n=1 Tax=Desulfovibrio sp. TomC TaxID=1562888 RepID=UPI0005BE7136|nr:hypothetical protein [Desulfovibrio sp. TomC]
MFIQNLSGEQKAVFLYLAHEVALADGNISGKEQQMMSTFCAQIPGVEPKKCSLCDLAEVFESKRARVSAFLELAAIAQAESGVNEEERKFLDSLASAFGLSNYEVNDMLSWVVRQFNLFNEAQAFMED